MTALRWLVVNLCMTALLWSGFVGDELGPYRVAMFVVWLQIVGSLGALNGEIAKGMRDRGPPVPLWLSGTVQALYVAFLVWHGAVWSGAFLMLALVVRHAAYDKKVAP